MKKDISQSAIKFLSIVFYAIIGIITAILILSWYWITVYGPFMELDLATQSNMKALIVVLALAGIPLSFSFHQKKVKHIVKSVADEEMRIAQYRVAMLIKYATLEAITFLGVFGYLLSADLSFLFISIILVLSIALNYPSKEKMESELELEKEELE